MADQTLIDLTDAESLTDAKVLVHRTGQPRARKTTPVSLVQAGATTTPAAGAVPKADGGGRLPVGWIASGTPNGSQFVRDDGTLAVPPGTGASPTIREVDGSPSVSAGTIEFDQSQGLGVSSPGAGVARVTVATASESAKGVVQLAASGTTTAGQAVQASDTRLSDARTPTTHTHAAGDVTSGTFAAARLPNATTSVKGAVILSGDGGVSAGQVVQATDGRLSNARTPTAHNHSAAEITSGTLDAARLPAHNHSASEITTGTLGAARLPDATTTTKGAAQLAVSRETTAGRAVQANDPRIAEPWSVWRWSDHFHPSETTGVGERYWFTNGVSSRPAEAGHPGIARLTSSPSDGFNASLYLTDGFYSVHGLDVARLGVRLRLGQTADQFFMFGLVADEPSPGLGSYPTDGIIALLDPYDANWKILPRVGGTGSPSVSSTAPTTGWVDVELRRNGADWELWINGSNVADATFAGPNLVTTVYIALFCLGASPVTCDLDVLWFESKVL